MLAAFPPLYPLQFHLEALEPFRLPEYKGALFRGGFGFFFRDLVCVTRAPTCTGCPHLHECTYSTVFESPVEPAKAEVLRKYPNAPHPFVMVPPADSRTLLAARARLVLDVVLIGPGLRSLPHFLVVFDEMGRSGRFGGKFHLRRVNSALPGNELIFDGLTRRVGAVVPAWRPVPEAQPVHRAQLQFITPLRMRTGGVYNRSPNFVDIAHALLRRIHLLAAIYGGGGPSTDWMKPLLAAADAVSTEHSGFNLYPWQRNSGRQKRRISMDGVTGTLTAAGDLTALMPWLRAGEWINVGSATSLGLGKYRLTGIEPAPLAAPSVG